MDIEELKIENVIELFSVSDRVVNFKSMELTKIQCKQVLNFINQQQETIESLKCCRNCEHCLTMSQVPDKLHHATYCQPCIDNSHWQPIK